MANPSSPINLLVVLGPTASGKTRLGVELAHEFNGEIISADSRQVYRELNLGAGKDLSEYSAGGPAVPYHLIDVATLAEEFNVFRFQKFFYAAYTDISSRGRLPVVVGGTGLYLEAVLSRYALIEVPPNPELRVELDRLTDIELVDRLRELKGGLHNTTDTLDRARLIRAVEIAAGSYAKTSGIRPDLNPLIVGVRYNRDELRGRILSRLRARLAEGLVAEIDGLLKQGVPADRLRRLGLEYRFGVDFLQGIIPTDQEFENRLYLAICDFAKRQETWFRRMERRGLAIHWIVSGDAATAKDLVCRTRGAAESAK